MSELHDMNDLLDRGLGVLWFKRGEKVVGATLQFKPNCNKSPEQMAAQIKPVLTAQGFSGPDLESALRQAVELEATPY